MRRARVRSVTALDRGELAADRGESFDTRPTRQMPRAEVAPVSARVSEDRPTMVICPCCDGVRMITVERAAQIAEAYPDLFPTIVVDPEDLTP